MRFQFALTNPPFSMRKKASEADQRIILQDYNIREYKDSQDKTRLKSSLKSNVMFLERYHDILDDNGTLITVIDESVLNTDSDRSFRDWMLRNYYVKAVISLPQWAFFEAGSNVKTSILFLVKKATPSEDQPFTFYARSENIGYDMMKQDEQRSDLPAIRDAYFAYKRTGEVPVVGKTAFSDKAKFFVKKLDYGTRRIDFEWFDPRHEELNRHLERISTEKGYKLETIGHLLNRNVCEIIKGKTSELYVSQGIPILKVRNVTNEGIIWKASNVLKDFFDSNPKCHLRPKDILITSTGVGTIGRVAMVDRSIDCMTDGHVTALRVLNEKEILPSFLTHYLRSIFGQMQMEKYTVGSTGQTELNDPDIALIKIAYPESVTEQQKILDCVQPHEDAALKSRNDFRVSLEKAREEFQRMLTK